MPGKTCDFCSKPMVKVDTWETVEWETPLGTKRNKFFFCKGRCLMNAQLVWTAQQWKREKPRGMKARLLLDAQRKERL